MQQTDGDELVLPQGVLRAVIVSIIAAALLFGATYAAYKHANRLPGTIILPGGQTYLGPSPTTIPTPAGQIELFTADESTPTKEWKGQKYPFTFEYPENLSLGLYPDDPYDTVTVFWKETDSNANIFLRVEDLSKNEESKQLIGKSLQEYAEWWGKQYIWKYIESVSDFTTGQKLKGLWVKFRDEAGAISGDNYFLAVPGKPNLVIWMSSRIISPQTFDKMVNSLRWDSE